MYLHDLKSMHTHIALPRVHEGTELQALNCNLYLKWVYQDWWPNRVSMFHEIAKFVLRNPHHDNELLIHWTIHAIRLPLHLNRPEKSMYCTEVKPMFRNNFYSIEGNLRTKTTTKNTAYTRCLKENFRLSLYHPQTTFRTEQSNMYWLLSNVTTRYWNRHGWST